MADHDDGGTGPSPEERRALDDLADATERDSPVLARRLRSGATGRDRGMMATAAVAVVLVPLIAVAAAVSPGLAGAIPTVLLLGAALDHLRTLERVLVLRAEAAASSGGTRPETGR